MRPLLLVSLLAALTVPSPALSAADTGDAESGKSPAADVLRPELSPLPTAPESRILDQARVFTFHPELRNQLTSRLRGAWEERQFDIYVAAYSFLLNETIEQRAERLRQAWVSQPQGIVVVYVRGGGQMTFAASPEILDFIPRNELEEMFSIAALTAREFDEPAERLHAAVAENLRLLAERVDTRARNTDGVRRDTLELALLVSGAVLALALVMGLFARWDRRQPEEHFFPPVRVESRFGAAFAGGSLSEVSYRLGSVAPPPAGLPPQAQATPPGRPF